MRYNSKPLTVTGNARPSKEFKEALQHLGIKFDKLLVTSSTGGLKGKPFQQTVTNLTQNGEHKQQAIIHYIHDSRNRIRFDRVE